MKNIVKITLIALLSLFFAIFFSCAYHHDAPEDIPEVYECTAWNLIDSIDFLDSITCPEEFDRIQGAPLSQIFSEVKSVKLVYEIASEKMYFIESKKYQLHFNFCRDMLGYKKPHTQFNQEQYGSSQARAYILPSLNYYTACDKYTVEFFAGDQVTNDQIADMFTKIHSLVYFYNNLYFMPTSQSMEERTKGLVGKIPFIYSDEVFKGQNYQACNNETGYGYLKKIAVDQIEKVYLSRHEIILTNGVPNDISVVAGIITTDFQTPLSHINVLSRNRGTPNMALKDGWTNPHVNNLVDKLVFLTVKADTFLLSEASLSEAEAFWAKKEPTDTIYPPCDDSTTGLFDMEDLDHDFIHLVGAKAANFAEMTKIEVPDMDPVPVPEGAFAIPFFYYSQHMRENGLDTVVESMLEDSDFKTNIAVREQMLSDLRDRIKDAPINQEFLDLVINKVVTNSTWRRMRFRSSTNVEDLKQFNGAGLYSSKTGLVADNSDRPVDKAIKEVWSSLWNFRAFEEREYFKVVHLKTAMGLLVHRSFPDELANGVAITRNIVNPNLYGFTINVQQGEVSIVFPPPNVTCDQLIFYTFHENPYENPAIEYISHSSILPDGKTSVLSEQEAVKLAKYLAVIKTHFYFNVFKEGQFAYFAMDVEFKIDLPTRELYIKQARPYK